MVLLYAPSHRQDNTYHGLCCTSSGALAGTRNISMGPLHEGSIRRPIVPWANALTTELHLAPCDYEFSDEYFLDERDLVSTWNISAPPTPPHPHPAKRFSCFRRLWKYVYVGYGFQILKINLGWWWWWWWWWWFVRFISTTLRHITRSFSPLKLSKVNFLFY